jgi:hypothetical protein
MKKYFLLWMVVFALKAAAQNIPNGDFKKWGNEYDKCPTGWGCNNDADCTGKVTQADKLKGGAKLTVVHCWDPKKDDRSNNVNMNYDELSAKIPKGKKVKISFDYSYVPVGNDQAYVKIDIDIDEELTSAPAFFYNDADKGVLKPGFVQHFVCTLSFDPLKPGSYMAPQHLSASSIRTTFGIMPAAGTDDTHKGSALVINHVKFEME